MKKAALLPAALTLFGTALAENSLYTSTETYYEVSGGGFLQDPAVRVLIAVVVGLVVALVRVQSMKAKLQTAHSRSGASDYVQEGSLALDVKQDRFLYQRTQRIRIQTSQPAPSGGGRPASGGGASRGGGGNRIR